MAADGGFSTKPMGFDKNEVNEYISSLRKRMNEIEAEVSGKVLEVCVQDGQPVEFGQVLMYIEE